MNLGLGLGALGVCVPTYPFCSEHVAENDVAAQGPSDIYPRPVTSDDAELCVLTDTLCSPTVAENDVTEVCRSTKQYF